MESDMNAALIAARRKSCTNTHSVLFVTKEGDGFTVILFDLTGENPRNLLATSKETDVPPAKLQSTLQRLGKLVSQTLGAPPIFLDEEHGPEGGRILTLVKDDLKVREFGGERRVVFYTQQG